MPAHHQHRSSIAQSDVTVDGAADSLLGNVEDMSTPNHLSPKSISSNSTNPFMLPPPNGFDHARRSSLSKRKHNRLSLSFPVAPASSSASSATIRHTPSSSTITSFPPTPSEARLRSAPISPSDPSHLLTAVASQERRVLELKEELTKAEADLKSLKKQWHIHEATRKRAEIRNTAQLQPMQRSSIEATSRTSMDSTSTRQSVEIDRKKTLLASAPTETRRKVFRGGHTRTLSLLSPERQNFDNVSVVSDDASSVKTEPGATSITKATDTSQGLTKVSSTRANASNLSSRNSYQGGMSYVGKQLADGVRSGLWTFIEDLRQATVGDEAVNTPEKRPNPDALNVRKNNRKASRGDLAAKRGFSPRRSLAKRKSRESLGGRGTQVTILRDADLFSGAPRTASGTVKMKPMALAPPVDDDDGWSNWDSPAPRSPIRWSGSSLGGSSLGAEAPNTPSMKGGEIDAVRIGEEAESHTNKPDELPWPKLEKLSPSNIRRSVTNFLDEWEMSVTPPLERESSSTPKATDFEQTDFHRTNGLETLL